MPASVNDKFMKVKGFFSTTLSAQKTSGAASMSLSDATGVPTTTGLVFTVGRVDSSGTATPSARAIYKGTLSGTTVSNLTLAEGTDQTHAAGTVVEITWTETHVNNLVDGILVQHNQDGTHGAVTATSIATDIITENTTDTGVTIDGVLIKDGLAYGGGVLGETRFYTASGATTWNKPTGLKYVIVECKGGGGGGGGVGTASGVGAAGGGGEGARSYKKILAASLGGTETVTVGAGGSGGVGNAAGSTGTTTSFGAHCTAAGGSGGAGSTGATNFNFGGNGGSSGTADLRIAGAPGCVSVTNGADYRSGAGGGTGGGNIVGISSNGSPGVANSGGGGGGALDSATSSRTGGLGGSGYVIVQEYY